MSSYRLCFSSVVIFSIKVCNKNKRFSEGGLTHDMVQNLKTLVHTEHMNALKSGPHFPIIDVFYAYSPHMLGYN